MDKSIHTGQYNEHKHKELSKEVLENKAHPSHKL